MVGAVLFDGDQTLWDFQRVMRQALTATLAELRVARPGPVAEALREVDLNADRNAVARELEGVEFNLARLRQLGFARTLERFADADGWSAPENMELAHTLSVSYFAYRDRDPALFDDAVPCLDALVGRTRLGLLSNGSRLPETVGLGRYFDVVVFAQDHRVAKPDRGIFEVAERQLGLSPADCVLVGDHPLNDVVGAKRAGWRAVWLDRVTGGDYCGPHGCAEQPDAVITSLGDLPALVTTW